MELDNTEIRKRRLNRGAWLLTTAYLIVVAYFVHGQWDQMKGLEPNAIGDFLAGAFSPLAFLWLVVGYLQQGLELEQNTQALLLQHQEMKESVRQATELVKISQQELQAFQEQRVEEDRRRAEAIKASLVYVGQRINDPVAGVLLEVNLTLDFRNFGGDMVDLRISDVQGIGKISKRNIGHVARQGRAEVVVKWPAAKVGVMGPLHVVSFAMQYQDAAGTIYIDTVEVERHHSPKDSLDSMFDVNWNQREQILRNEE